MDRGAWWATVHGLWALDTAEEIWHICSNLTRKSKKRCREQIFLSVIVVLRAWVPKAKMLINFFMLSFSPLYEDGQT